LIRGHARTGKGSQTVNVLVDLGAGLRSIMLVDSGHVCSPATKIMEGRR